MSDIYRCIMEYIETSYDITLLELYYTNRTEAVSVITAQSVVTKWEKKQSNTVSIFKRYTVTTVQKNQSIQNRIMSTVQNRSLDTKIIPVLTT